MVDDLMNKDGSVSFYSAIQKVMEQTPKGVRAIENKKIIKAAGVEHMEKEASNTIQGAANWPNLADFFKIERGVDNQGPNILEKTSRTFDGDHNWRPEPDPTVCCVERWVASVKTAVEYIKTNYTVSGGNYFRQNADVPSLAIRLKQTLETLQGRVNARVNFFSLGPLAPLRGLT